MYLFMFFRETIDDYAENDMKSTQVVKKCYVI
jgi:hypothetical protein